MRRASGEDRVRPPLLPSPGADPAPEALQWALGPPGAEGGGVAERPADRVAELLQRAAEELPRGLELRPEPKEPELVVARDVHAAAELVEDGFEEGFVRVQPDREVADDGIAKTCVVD